MASKYAESSTAPVQGTGIFVKDWNSLPLYRLIFYIMNKHHFRTKQDLPRIDGLLIKVCTMHGEQHPELFEIKNLFWELDQELLLHMLKEEKVLFPQIIRMEEVAGLKAIPASYRFVIEEPISMVMHEHDGALELLRKIREKADNYAAPSDADINFESLYDALHGLEKDLFEHFELEDEMLFPRALEIEKRLED